jgi:hypothetical protein
MTQDQLLDQVCELITAEAKKGPGTLLLLYDTDFKVMRIPKFDVPGTKLIETFDCERIQQGLPPSNWLGLSRQLWTIYSSKTDKTHTIKLPTLRGPKHEQTTGNTDNDGSRKPTG